MDRVFQVRRAGQEEWDYEVEAESHEDAAKIAAAMYDDECLNYAIIGGVLEVDGGYPVVLVTDIADQSMKQFRLRGETISVYYADEITQPMIHDRP